MRRRVTAAHPGTTVAHAVIVVAATFLRHGKVAQAC